MKLPSKQEGQKIQYDNLEPIDFNDIETSTWIERQYTKHQSDLIANLLSLAKKHCILSCGELKFVDDVIEHHRNPMGWN